jgi:hypothetical protein
MPGGSLDEGKVAENPVVLAETHAETTRRTVMTVPFHNTTQNAWRLPDSEIIRQSVDAERKTKALSMVLEEKRRWRFSDSH